MPKKMPKTSARHQIWLTAAMIALCALATAQSALAQKVSPPADRATPSRQQEPANITQGAFDLTGSYQCNPNPSPCLWSGKSATVRQSGSNLQIKGDNGAMADAVLTSATTIAAGGTFNSLGIVGADKSIDWSDGTKWKKQ